MEIEWGRRVERRPLQPGELGAIDIERRREEAEQAKNRAVKSPRTEEDAFEILLGSTGQIGLDSIDFASDVQADRFFAWLEKRRAGQENKEMAGKLLYWLY